jgi:hypothetical protein
MTEDTTNDDEYNPNCESYKEYRERLEMMADVIEDRLDDDPELEITELVFEEVDSCHMVIYTHDALNALRFCDEGPSEWKHLVAETDSWQKVIMALAFDAVRNDLWAELNRRDLDSA